MTLIDPDPITPQQWEANYKQRMQSLSETITVGLLASPTSGPHERRHAREAELLARRWSTYKPGPRHTGDIAVETVDGMTPKVSVHSLAEAARLCGRSPVAFYQAMQNGQRCGGRYWKRSKR